MAHTNYPIIAISDPGGERSEPMGTKRKFWSTWDNQRWLFKYNRPDHGEDWSEKIAAELGRLLQIPCATVQFARCADSPGVVSRNFINDFPSGSRLVHGNELLTQHYGPSYPSERSFHVSEHCVSAVKHILAQLPAPQGVAGLSAGSVKTLWDAFAGYLMLDALIGNTDRHHENWGIITVDGGGGVTTLAPSFDHASSLGRELDDIARKDMLEARGTRSVDLYAKRCRSKLYFASGDAKPLSPLEAFVEATRGGEDVRRYWLEKLELAQESDFKHIIERVPEERMSADAKDFAFKLLMCNMKMLLDVD